MSTRRAAFSLVELLILVTAALVVAGLSVPVLRGMTLASNEESARETLVRLRDFQIRHREKGTTLGPGGSPRFGTLTELVRAGLSLEDSFPIEGGAVLVRHGYCFQYFFATRSGGFTADATDPLVLDSPEAFVIYAWPEVYRRSGSAVFAIDPSGRLRPEAAKGILESKNLLANYSGLRRPPKPFAASRQGADAEGVAVPTRPEPGGPASSPTAAPGKPLRRNERGEDGELWELTPVPAGR